MIPFTPTGWSRGEILVAAPPLCAHTVLCQNRSPTYASGGVASRKSTTTTAIGQKPE